MLINPENAPHYTWGQGCDSWVLVENEGLSIKKERMPAHTREVRHFHQTAQQFFYILEGSATFYIADQKMVVQAPNGLQISPQTPHYIANETKLPLVFLVISQPSTLHDRHPVQERS